jgi:hypothetical protein
MRTPMILALLLTTAFAHAAEQKRDLPAFDAISSKGAINMIVQVGQAQSVRVTGDDKFIGQVAMKVVGGELVVTIDNEKNVRFKKDSKILVTLPALKAFRVEGAGLAELNNISGDRMDIQFEGAGRLVANGKVKMLKLNAQGVGEIDTKALLAQHANVNFEGIGRVKVYASERLDATVEGMGSLNYYGNPKTVNKTAEGIGRVKAGD